MITKLSSWLRNPAHDYEIKLMTTIFVQKWSIGIPAQDIFQSNYVYDKVEVNMSWLLWLIVGTQEMCRKRHVRFTTVPNYKLCLISYKLDIDMFVSLKQFVFISGFSVNKKLTLLKTNILIIHILLPLNFLKFLSTF